MPTPDQTVFFNAHHAPMGAFATFTLGEPGPNGGLGLELGRPACQNVYIGVESREGGRYRALPFYRGTGDEAARYDVEKQGGNGGPDAGGDASVLSPYGRERIRRDFQLGTDSWAVDDLVFTLYNPVGGIPDPASADPEALLTALAPGVLAELTVDNTAGTRERTAFFGFSGSDPYSNMRRLEDTTDGQIAGVANGLSLAIAARAQEAQSALGFDMPQIFTPQGGDPWNRHFGLGGTGALLFRVPAGARCTFQIAICFYRGGIATSGMDTRYLYTRWFDRIEAVAAALLARFATIRDAAVAANDLLDRPHLSAEQRFMMAHAIKAYYASTELLERDGDPIWVVNEGEYRMMNTFDLTVDHLYFELATNPWVVRNTLDLFVERYSYTDQLHFPGGENRHPGGRSFTHDMGVGNVWSRPQYSSYELTALHGCFSHMTHEQLTNFICCATAYVAKTQDLPWARRHDTLWAELLDSLVNRDHPDPQQRNGIMALDSSRTRGGAEITTYDSLDVSLGQARNNLYLAVKTWAAYVCLAPLLKQLGHEHLAATARAQARRAADTLCRQVTPGGYIPAVILEGNDSRIIPAIEGLIFPHICGLHDAIAPDGHYPDLIAVLTRHLHAVLRPGVCLFPDGGWKISSTSDNSWLSKIYLCQHVARHILHLPWDSAARRADSAHAAWLLDPRNTYWSWSDQIVAGIAKGSKYYPRGVTCILWLDEDPRGPQAPSQP